MNIGDDGQTVRFRMDNLIMPGSQHDVVNHTLGVIDQINAVLPVERACLRVATRGALRTEPSLRYLNAVD